MLLYIYSIVTLFDVLYSFPHYVFLLVITFIGLKCWNFVPSAFIFLKTFLAYVLFWKVFLLDMELWLAVTSHSCWKVECKLDFLLLVNFSLSLDTFKMFLLFCNFLFHVHRWFFHSLSLFNIIRFVFNLRSLTFFNSIKSIHYFFNYFPLLHFYSSFLYLLLSKHWHFCLCYPCFFTFFYICYL